MLRFFSVFAVTIFLSSCVTETVVRDENYVKEKKHFEKYGPDYKFVSSGEIVPNGDKLAAALECDVEFEQEWSPNVGRSYSTSDRAMATTAALTVLKAAVKNTAKEKHMIECMAKKDMELSDENAERWWPTKFSKEEPDLHPQESGTL